MKIAFIEEGVLVSYVTAVKIPFASFMELCSYRPNGYQFSPKFQAGYWDGRIRLAKTLQANSYSFPSGLLESVREFFIDHGFKIKEKRGYKVKELAKSDIATLKTKTLRDYQIDAVAMALYHKRGVIKAPTGSGKSLVAAALIKTIRKETLFLTHSMTILRQTADVFKRELGEKFVGIIGDKVYQPDPPVTVASVQTFYRNIRKYSDLLARKRVLIGDEIHHATSTSWYKIMQQVPAIYRIGLTATPAVGGHKLLLEAATGKVIYTIASTKLIEEGYLSKPRIYMLEVDKGRLSYRLDYHAAYKNGLTHYPYRNRMIANCAKFLSQYKEFKPIIIQVKRLSHMRILKKYLIRRNVNVASLQGADEAAKRQHYFKLVKKSKLDVLLVSTILDEGVDLPNIRTLIVAPGDWSPIKTIQRLGRGMRTTKKKKEVIVIDFFDYTHEYLLKHSKKRRATYKREKHDVEEITYLNFKRRIEKECQCHK